MLLDAQARQNKPNSMVHVIVMIVISYSRYMFVSSGCRIAKCLVDGEHNYAEHISHWHLSIFHAWESVRLQNMWHHFWAVIYYEGGISLDDYI